MVVDAAKADGYSLDTMDEEFQSGGEDWPIAYHYTPQAERDAECCVVVYFHPQWGAAAFHIYAGLLFGCPLSVTSFNR